ncbi:hypothetical protein RSPPQCQH_CDS0017 [Mycolicibacterium phage phi1_186001]
MAICPPVRRPQQDRTNRAGVDRTQIEGGHVVPVHGVRQVLAADGRGWWRPYRGVGC